MTFKKREEKFSLTIGLRVMKNLSGMEERNFNNFSKDNYKFITTKKKSFRFLHDKIVFPGSCSLTVQVKKKSKNFNLKFLIFKKLSEKTFKFLNSSNSFKGMSWME